MSALHRRSFQVRDDGSDRLKDRKVEVVVLVDGTIHTRVEARRPGMVAVLGYENGTFDVEVIEEGGKRYTDVRVSEKESTPLPWQREAVEGLKR